MTPFQQGLFHLVAGVVAVAGAVVLALLNKITGTDALAILISATGIVGTGVGSVVSGVKTAAQTAAAASPPKPVLTPPATS